MGAWGYKPFQNDSVLNYYGGFHSTEEMEKLLQQGIKGEHTHCNASFEICGIILRTFNLYNSIINDVESLKIVATSMNNKKFNEETDQSLDESMGTMLSVASISVETREELLTYAMQSLKKWIEDEYKNAKFKELETPIEGKKYSGIYIWNQELSDEADKTIQEVYNMAAQTVACNFSNVKQPIKISPKSIDWLMKSLNTSNKNKQLNHFKKEFPNGAYLCTDKNKYIIGINTNVMDEEFGKYYDNLLKKYPNCGLKRENLDTALKLNFKQGFIAVDEGDDVYTLKSIDYGDTVQGLYGPFMCNMGFIKYLMRIMPIYKSEEHYNSINKNSKVTAQYHAIAKLYKKGNSTNIIGYEITDGQSVKRVAKEFIKEAIASGKVTFDNLTLTSDGRLIMTNK